MARPTKISKEVIKRLSEAIKIGASYTIASHYAGICYSTFRNWIVKAEKAKSKKRKNREDSLFLELLDSVKKAEAKNALLNLGIIQREAQRDWKAAGWLLERRHKYTKESKFDGIKTTVDDQASVFLLENMSPLTFLKRQQKQLLKATEVSFAAGSFQAYNALMKQLFECTLQLERLEKEGEIIETEALSDAQLLDQMISYVQNMPDVLRQRVVTRIAHLDNKE